MVRPNDINFSIVLDNRMIEALSERSRVLTREQALIDLIRRRVFVRTEVSKNDRSFFLEPGEAETSIRTLADDWKWDRKTVRKFLNTLADTGCIRLRHLTYATVADFPTLISSSTEPNSSSPLYSIEKGTTNQILARTSSVNEREDSSDNNYKMSVRYDKGPLILDDGTRSLLKNIYTSFRDKLPLLEIPPYNERTEKAIYDVFILGMKGDMELMLQFLDKVAKDENMNGEMAELSGDSNDKESFVSLFSPRWQEILFPASP